MSRLGIGFAHGLGHLSLTNMRRASPRVPWAILSGRDVRKADEFARGHIPNAINLPLSQMRDRYAELPTNREIWTCCGVGQRAYFATRFLMQHGHVSRNMSREGIQRIRLTTRSAGTHEGGA